MVAYPASAPLACEPPPAIVAGLPPLRLEKMHPLAVENLLQAGYFVSLSQPVSLLNFLLTTMALAPAYVEDRLQTIFLNGSPVDDLQAAIISPGSRLALCAAMPGLVGATMRRAGILAGFRQSISLSSRQNAQNQRADAADQASATGFVFVRLFNLVAREIGAQVLSHGVLVPAGRLAEWLTGWPEIAAEAYLDQDCKGQQALRIIEAQPEHALVRLESVASQ